MKHVAYAMTILMLASLMAGCAGNGSDEKDEKITSLETDLSNMTADAEESAANAALLQSTLTQAQADLDIANAVVENLSTRLSSAEWHRTNLSNALSEAMDQLNQTENDELIAQLEANIASLNSEISEMDAQVADLQSQVTHKENEIASLEATNTALQSTITSLTYDIREMINSCPLDNPGLEMVGGFDDGRGSTDSEDGVLEGEEIQFRAGECPGDSGMVSDLQDGDGRDWGPALFVEMGGNLYFAGYDGIHGWELWRSDGTVGGTYMVKDLRGEECDSDGQGGVECENGGGLATHCWGAPFGCHYPEIVAGNNKIFFTGFDGEPGTESTVNVIVSDGTASGTHTVRQQWQNWGTNYDGENGWGTGYTGARNLLVIPSSGIIPDRVVYTVMEVIGGDSGDTHPPWGDELWITDGTDTGTYMLANIVPEDESWEYDGATYCCGDFQGSTPRSLIKKGNSIWFTAETDDYGRELYRYGLSAIGGGLFLIKDINSGEEGSNPMYLTSGSNGAYFSANNGSTGQELYFSQGDAFSTKLVKDIWIGAENNSDPSNLIKFGEKLFFTADDGQNGRELWISDTTEEGTYMVKDINTNGSSDPNWLRVMDGVLYFMAYTEDYGTELWRSDGTVSGTSMVKDINPGSNSSFFWLPSFFHGELMLVHEGELFFTADDGVHGAEPWRSDGTSNGTNILIDATPGVNSSWSNRYIAMGEKVYFTPYSEERGRQLWFYWDNPGPIIGATEDS